AGPELPRNAREFRPPLTAPPGAIPSTATPSVRAVRVFAPRASAALDASGAGVRTPDPSGTLCPVRLAATVLWPPLTADRPPRSPGRAPPPDDAAGAHAPGPAAPITPDRKSTRLNSSHVKISYAVFC